MKTVTAEMKSKGRAFSAPPNFKTIQEQKQLGRRVYAVEAGQVVLDYKPE